MKRRRIRAFVLAGYLVAGAMMTQALTICNSVATAGLSTSGLLIDDNGYFLGLVYVCGTENIVPVDANGNAVGLVQNSQDDLMFGCPVRQVTIP